MTLKTQKEVVHKVSYNELDRFIRQAYGNTSYEFAADQECGNDSQHRFDVSKVEELLDEWDERQVSDFRAGKYPSFITRALLQDCVNRGVIEPGVYLVEVSW